VAQTKRKRRRKHRGTQTGKIDTRPRGRPRNRAEARSRAQSRSSSKKGRGRQQQALSEPTWRGAVGKGAIAALLFFVLLGVLFKRPLGAAAGVGAFMLLFYIPMSYYTDRFFYRRRQRQAEKARIEKAQRGADGG